MSGFPLLACSVLLIATHTSSLAATASPGEDSKALVAHLKSKDDAELQGALQGLKELGAPGLDGLLKATKHEKAWVRATAWHWIEGLGADAKPALEPLCNALSKPPRDEWASTAELALGFGMQIGMIGAFVKGGPIPVQRDSNKEEQAQFEALVERLSAMSALVKLGSAEPAALVPWIDKAKLPLDRGYLDLHACFAAAIASSGEAGKAVLKSGLSAESPRVHVACLVACCMVGKKSGDLGPDIDALLGSPEPAVRALASEAHFGVRQPCDAVRARLLELVQDPSAYVRVHAARALATGCEAATEVLPAIEKGLTDSSPFVRLASIEVLGSLSKEPLFPTKKDFVPIRSETAVKPLTSALSDASAEIRKRAAQTLGNYGAPAKSALPALHKLEKDPDSAVRKAVAAAIQALEKS